MFSFLFRALLLVFLLGIIVTLISQRSWTDPAEPSKSAVSEAGDGPAEKIGAVVDRGLNKLGEITEEAGENLQKATKN